MFWFNFGACVRLIAWEIHKVVSLSPGTFVSTTCTGSTVAVTWLALDVIKPSLL